jgi:phosphoinositide-3-kinase, regulatory subunit 4
MTTLSAASASIDVPELADLNHDKTLASARFMKSIRARSQHGFVFVKAVMKPYPTFDVQKYVKRITHERNALAQIPNTLAYQRVIEVATGGFLVRQFIFSSVYDRMSTRPFLEDIEKKWLAYQLLCAVRDSHAQDIYHGDIKSENVLVTSWNWLYLADYSSAFKPATLPEDNPANFSFYFDTSGRRTCYIAPERFINSPESDSHQELNWSMDMFSVGCVIAEIFLEGPIFSLSQIFKYKTGEYSPEHTHLNKIEDSDVRDMVLNMIDLDPERRYNADQNLSFYKGKIFPDYFESFLHQYMFDLTLSASRDDRYGLDVDNLVESDEKIDRVWQDFDKISYFLGYGSAPQMTKQPGHYPGAKQARKDGGMAGLQDGSLIFLTLVSSSLRNSTRASSRLKACDLLVALAERLPDEIKLDRIIPYIVTLLSDPVETVQLSALRALASIFEMVQVVSPINAFIFPEYIFPKLRIITSGQTTSSLVRAAYASQLASLALSSARILDMVQAIRADGRLPALNDTEWTPATSYHALYDPSKDELIKHFEEATVALITDDNSAVRRALLGSVPRLCIFFGSSKANEVILTHINTYLNENNWLLKCSFFDALVGITTYVGTSALERFILPIMVGSLTDPEGFVVQKVLGSLARMADLGLLQKATVWELVSMAARFLIHPSSWIRESAVQFIVLSAKYISKADLYCILLPMLTPYTRSPILEMTETQLLDHLKKPLSRQIYSMAETWASQKPRSLFWTSASLERAFVLSEPGNVQSPGQFGRRPMTRIPPSQRDKDDQLKLEAMKGVKMTADDESKLLALREYILRCATTQRQNLVDDDRLQTLQNIISLHTIDVNPTNVFIDTRAPLRPRAAGRPALNRSHSTSTAKHTLAAALLDASTTIHGPPSRQSTQVGTPVEASSPVDIRGRAPDNKPGAPANFSATSSRDASASKQPSSSELDKLSLRRGKLELRHRNSAMNLMKRDQGKADAETSTSDEMAFGKVDGLVSYAAKTAAPSALTLTAKVAADTRSRSPLSRASMSPVYEANHSYEGRNPNVLRLLDKHFADNYAIDTLEFGEIPEPVGRMPIRNAIDLTTNGTTGAHGTNSGHTSPWRPAGQILTHFAEHTAAINGICVAPDHGFFVTASDDGSCKIWDTMRLEKNVTPRSRHTYRHATDSKVKALCFVENSHTFISAADDGSIHAVRVEYKIVDKGEGTKYGRPMLVRDFQIPPPSQPSQSAGVEHAIQLYHYRSSSSQSLLVAATSHNRILLIDLKTMAAVDVLTEPLHHGNLSCFIVDRHHHWMLAGTSHGVLSLYDLRYRIRLRSFMLPTKARIDRIVAHPSKGHGRWVMISAAGEISVWDIDKMTCREVLRPYTWNEGRAANKATPYTPLSPDAHPTPNAESTQDVMPTPEPTLDAVHVVVDFLHPRNRGGSQSSAGDLSKHAILLTGGADCSVRYWDLPQPENSYVVSGPMIHSDDSSSTLRATYTVSHPLSLSSGAQIQLTQEGEPEVPSRSGKKKDGGRKRKTEEDGTATPSKSTSAATNKPTRNTLLANFGHHLLSTPMDTVTDVVVLKKPYGILVCVDRSGSILCFQ